MSNSSNSPENSGKAAGRKPPRGRPFQKGQSGNPGGRPKEAVDLKELARSHTKEAIERLAFWMRSDNARASVSAATALLDRGFGKPAQQVDDGINGGGVTFVFDDPTQRPPGYSRKPQTAVVGD